MQCKAYDIDRINIMETVFLCEFLSALGTDSPANLLRAEEDIYNTFLPGGVGENDLRRMYFQMIYQMELSEAYISNTEESATRVYMEIRDIHTLEEFHEEFLRRVCQRDFMRENTYSEAVANTIRNIQNELNNRDLGIQLLAQYVYLTPNYLAAIFKKETGMTIGQYCLQQRMERARQLLMNKELKLNQIAQMVGYRDAEYFSKIFKREVGCIPSKYREQKGAKGTKKF